MSCAERARVVGLCPPNPPAFTSPPGCLRRLETGRRYPVWVAGRLPAEPALVRDLLPVTELRSGRHGGRIPVPVPMPVWSGERNNAHPKVPATHDVPCCGQTRECLADTLVARADGRAE